ncbi:hypothetical protein B0T24DRAFT_526584 [Lasiosphaeria ovina]|uniref:Uncharacterized protein n=1 Tax=Lasiosphaeria ovina TaxID=92902 RepID=A0AAE0N9Q2_9PEZI|nr:hypothetical protein B0T24DRAFT_526584 [Lasiosphaeria ovina]
MLPSLEVGHLPSSSSFYAAIVQPLGLRYLSTEDGPLPSINYGTSLREPPVFRIRQVAASSEQPLRLSRITLSAPSADSADDAFAFAARANPDTREPSLRHPFEARAGPSARRSIGPGGETRVKITDFDGNTMEIVYRPPVNYPSHYAGSTLRATNSTKEEASRILHWNYDVASSVGPDSALSDAPRSGSRRVRASYPEDEPYPALRRSFTADSPVYESSASPRENSHGLSAGAVVGTLLGAAAGAAFTYGMVRNARSRAPRQEFDVPSFSRHATFPDQYPERRGQFVEAERVANGTREYASRVEYRAPPEFITRYSQAGRPSKDGVADYMYDGTRSRHSSLRSRTYLRPRSEAATNRQPLILAETEHRSYLSPSRSSKHHPPIVQRSYTYDTPERESYVSARSHRSSSTIRAPPPAEPAPVTPSHTVTRSRSRTAGSRATTTTFLVGGDQPNTQAFGRAGSYLSPWHYPLPPSGVGSSNARYDDGEDGDDDTGSIGPDDSISCIGSSRRSGRSYY